MPKRTVPKNKIAYRDLKPLTRRRLKKFIYTCTPPGLGSVEKRELRKMLVNENKSLRTREGRDKYRAHRRLITSWIKGDPHHGKLTQPE